jgi:hypothetical protein
LQWLLDFREQLYFRRVLLERGHTSESIDRGEFTEADAKLLMQPLEAIGASVSAIANKLYGDDFSMDDAVHHFSQTGILKEITNAD